MENNILLLTDSYKLSHAQQYPPNTTNVYSYFESRGGEFDEIVFFGLQYLLLEYLSGQVVTHRKIEEAEKFSKAHMGDSHVFNKEGWEHILYRNGGMLPISIKAVPEGTVVPPGNVMMTVENTDPDCWWLTNFLETLLVQVWYPSTVATVSREMKKIILKSLKKTGDPAGIDFKLHDFGFRGVETVESAGIGGCAHLVNFLGTDTVQALRVADWYYKCPMAGFSIPASEHSTITSWGKENEVKAFENMLDQWPTGLVACVSDSFNIYEACEKLWGTELKDKVLARDGALIIRPDSGDPDIVLPKILEILGEKFGYTTNNKGYKVLNPKVRIIQGDGVDRRSLEHMLFSINWRGWSSDNIAFGSGGGLLQQVNRDTCKFAFKCSDVVVDGKHRDVYKQPVDCSWKTSKKGRLKLIKDEEGKFCTVSDSARSIDYLEEIFRDGYIKQSYSLDTIRERAQIK